MGPRQIALRGCQPRDLIDQALALAQYLDEPRRLTIPLLEAACATYFVDDTQGGMALAVTPGLREIRTSKSELHGICLTT